MGLKINGEIQARNINFAVVTVVHQSFEIWKMRRKQQRGWEWLTIEKDKNQERMEFEDSKGERFVKRGVITVLNDYN